MKRISLIMLTLVLLAGCGGNVGESTQVDLDAEIYSRRHAANRRRDDV